ncbi:uncharacterized protein [Acropora muricata]|uniref:uncharacterized protein n=1 Tax=Acropora muricata TaxID=159855 RepID=UPI0034E528CE
MPRPYSEDLRWRTIWMKEMLGFQADEVVAVLWMSLRTIERYISKVLNSGDVKEENIVRPANSVAMHPHVEFLIMEAVLEHPDKTPSEIVYSVYAQTGSEFPLASIFYYLQRNHVSQKKLNKIALQRSEEARVVFRSNVCALDSEMFVFIDESEFDKRISRNYRRSLVGKRVVVKKFMQN